VLFFCGIIVGYLRYFRSSTHAGGVFQDHFAHEEDLLKSYRFGEGGASNKQRRMLGPGALSVQEGHAADHARILALARKELERAAAAGAAAAAAGAGASSSDSKSGASGSNSRTLRVRASVCRQVAAAFVTHAEMFDALYDSHIPATAL
jgi:hypothetical protein